MAHGRWGLEDDMKVKKSAGAKATAVALSAALVAGAAVPAFATDAGDTEGDQKLNNTADTPVYIDVERAVLRVAVPMDLRMVASSAGGPLTCPSDDVYGIWNYSTNTAVYVKQVEAVYNDAVNKDGVNWRLVTDPSLVGHYRETDGADLANLMITMVAPEAQGGADAFALDASQPKIPAGTRTWRIGKADIADGSEAQGVMFPLNFQKDGCANSIVRDARLANRLSQGDKELGIDPAAAFRLKFTITTARP